MERWEKERKEYLNSLTELLLDKEKITWYELDHCINIESVAIGPKVKTIDTGVFLKSPKLTKIEIAPENGNFYMDGGCLIERQSNSLIVCLGQPRIPDYIDTVFTDVFNTRESADKLFIHKNVKKIKPFEKFCSFKEIEIEQGNTHYEAESGCVYERGGSKVILGSEQSVIGSRADAIGRNAFSGCGFKRFEIPACVKTIGDYAFYNCFNLEEIIFNEGLEKIGEFAFGHNTALKSLNLPNSLSKTERGAFYGCCALQSIESFGGLTEISSRCFTECGLKTVSVGGKIKKLCDDAFYFSRDLEEFTACDGLEEIGSDVFWNCEKLKKVTLADTVSKLDDGAFGVCESLTDVKLSKAIKEIPVKCFYECKSLGEIDFPEGLQRIESWAFYNCSKLQRTNAAELKSIKKIYSDAFTGCRKLKKEGLGKRPLKLPKSFYSLESFEEITKTAEKGKSYDFMSVSSLGSFLAKFEGGVEVDGKKYLCLRKKDLQFFAEIASKLSKDDIAKYYDVYLCTLVENADLAEKIKTAAALK